MSNTNAKPSWVNHTGLKVFAVDMVQLFLPTDRISFIMNPATHEKHPIPSDPIRTAYLLWSGSMRIISDHVMFFVVTMKMITHSRLTNRKTFAIIFRMFSFIS